MKKFYSLLGAFAVAALGAVSASAAALPTDLLTVTPEQGTSYDINEFPTSITLTNPSYGQFQGLTYNNDTYKYEVPAANTLTVTFPDDASSTYPITCSGNRTLVLSVPAADVKAHGAGTITFNANLTGLTLNSNSLADYTWTYTITGEVASNVIPDYGMPEGATFDSSWGGMQDPSSPLKDIHGFNLMSHSNFNFTSTGSVKLYKEANGEFTEEIATGVYGYNGVHDLNIQFNTPYPTDPGKYRIVVTFANNGAYNSATSTYVKNISFDCEIASKPDPVAAEYEFIPAIGTPINAADFPAQVAIRFNNAATLSGTAYNDLINVTAPDGSIVEISRSGTVTGNTVSYTVPAPTQNGEYKFTFNASGLKGTAENDADLIFPDKIEWQYTITGNKVAVPDNITITPAQGKAVQADFASGITIECPDASYTVRGDGASLTINGVKYDKNNTTVTANQQGNKIIFAVPATVFANGGTFDCEADLTGVEFRNGTFQVITLAATTFNWTWTLPEPANLPSLLIDGTANEEAAVEVAKGAKISFGTVPEGTKIYYKWTAAAENTVLLKAPAAGYTEYAEPIEINETGALSYYAENSAGASDVKTINFTVKSTSALPAGIESITPAPGSTVDDTLTEIVFTFNADQDYAQMLSNVTSATLTINGGTPISGVGTANANQSMDGKIKFALTSDVKWNDGENTVVFTRNDAKCAMGNNYLPETYSFTYLYEAPGQVLPPTNITVDPNPEQTQARAWLGTIKITFKDASELGMAAQMIAKPETATLTVNGVTFPANVGATGGFASEATLIFTVPETVTWNNGLNTVVFAKGEANAPYNTGADYIPETFSFDYNVDDSVAVEGIEIETAADYYTIEGIKVQNPEAGKLYIKVANGKASKVIIR